MRFQALPAILLSSAAIALMAPAARAETYEVKPGEDWSALSPKLKPGDEVVLLEGTHVAAAFEGLAGEPGKPIVFRSKDIRSLVQITPDREGVKLVDCRHIRLERFAIRNARRAGIVVEGTEPGRSSDIAVRDVYVLGTSGLSEQAGILVSRTDRFDLRRSRFENCVGAAVHLESVEGVAAEMLQLRASLPVRAQFGLLVVGDCRELDFNDVWIAGEFDVGISLGAKDAVSRRTRERTVADVPAPASVRPEKEPVKEPAKEPGQEPAASKPETDSDDPAKSPRVRAASFAQCMIRGVRTALELGSCELLAIRNCSIVEPTSEVFVLVRPPKERTALQASFRENVVVWRAGSISRFAAIVAGTDASGLRLGPNIWWSEELPSALPLLGPEPQHFPGTLEVPQTIDMDPDLDARGRILKPEARMFGRNVG
ncbi:MAG: hypothetical protein RL325_961 [Planctomycetota bacterium]|jgi:hypothetical protein